ncbi:MAG: MFS transporter [Pseudomonadota bacterium]
MQPPPSIAPDARHQTVTIAFLFAAYLASFGIFIPFFPVWLDSVGMNPSWIAVLVAVPLIMRVFTTSFVADRAEGFDDPRLPLLWLSVAATSCFAFLPLSTVFTVSEHLVHNMWAVLVVVAVMAISWNALLPLCDALAIQHVRRTGASYGKVRSWGSAAFILASFVAGVAVEVYTPVVIPWLILVTLASLILASAVLPRSFAGRAYRGSPPRTAGAGDGADGALDAQEGDRPKLVGGLRFLMSRKGALSVFVGAGLMQASHAVLYGFASLSWGAQGFSDTAIGFLWSFGVACEIALFWVSKPLIDRIGARGLLILGGIGGTVRWVALAMMPDLGVTALLQILHAFSFGMTHLATIEYAARRAGPRELRAAQGVYGVVSGALMAVATLASGPLYEALGAGAYIAMGALTTLGAIIIVVDRVSVPGGQHERDEQMG